MARWALGVSYDGTAFHGWQRQQQLPTVQGALEQALSKIADHPVSLHVAGRTDAGVHALAQVASFDTNAARVAQDWLRGGNGLTPDSVQVLWACPVDENFHPRLRATARSYRYVFYDGGANPLLRDRVWFSAALDADRMHLAAQSLLGEHDFSSFRGAGCQSLSPVRRVDLCQVRRSGSYVMMDIQANAFLLHMVRNIASALLDQGTGMAELDIPALLERRDRNQLGMTAPACGLYFVQAHYPQYDFPKPPGLSLLGS